MKGLVVTKEKLTSKRNQLMCFANHIRDSLNPGSNHKSHPLCLTYLSRYCKDILPSRRFSHSATLWSVLLHLFINVCNGGVISATLCASCPLIIDLYRRQLSTHLTARDCSQTIVRYITILFPAERECGL